MFAVPGWSVGTDVPVIQISNTQDASTSKSPKKRKKNAQDSDVEPRHLDQLWRRHIAIEGDSLEDDGKHEDHPKRRRKGQRKSKGRLLSAQNTEATDSRGHDASIEGGTEVHTYTNANKQQKRSTPHLRSEKNNFSPKTFNTTNDLTKNRDPVQGPIRSEATENIASSIPETGLTPLQARMREKLISSRFRHLNETLYTTSSASAFKLFHENPSLFAEYHDGFKRQVAAWPENPVHGFMKWIRQRGSGKNQIGANGVTTKKASKRRKKETEAAQESTGLDTDISPLPRNFRNGTCNILDLGCGDADLALALTTTPSPHPTTKALNLRIRSFDLASTSSLVEVADIRTLPLPDSSVDIAIFCLSLMGTNWVEFVEEAYRVLRWKGECWIAEVASRFTVPREVSASNRATSRNKKFGKKKNQTTPAENVEEFDVMEEFSPVPNSSTDVSAFITVLRQRGFAIDGDPDLSNKMFVRMRFVKSLSAAKGKMAKSDGDRTGKEWRGTASRQAPRENLSLDQETRALKPCVYKTR